MHADERFRETAPGTPGTPDAPGPPATPVAPAAASPASDGDPPSTPASPTAMDPLLAAWLAAGPASCPRCGYEVAAATRPACPECGLPLVLRVGLAEPVTIPWTIVLVLLALPPGLSGLFLVGSVAYEVANSRRPSLGPRAPDFVLIGLIASVPLAAWILGRRRFVRLPPAARLGLMATFGAIALALIVLAMRAIR